MMTSRLLAKSWQIRVNALSFRRSQQQGYATLGWKCPLVVSSSTDDNSNQNNPRKTQRNHQKISVSHSQPTITLSRQHRQQHRLYHATARREILPFVAGLTFVFIVRYSWKAMKHMDEEWEEYQWQLQQYEKAHRQDFVSSQTKYKDGTLAVDVGSLFIKLAHNGNGILATREGARSTFGGIVKLDNDTTLVGQPAMEKYWEVPSQQVDLARKSSSNSEATLLQVVSPAISDALERANLSQSKMRSVITVPASSVDDVNDPRNPWNAVASDNEIWKNAEWIPEPIAAVWGAQVQGDLPMHLEKPVLVFDMGAYCTSLSLVDKDVVTANVTLDWGAQTYVDVICDHVIENDSKLQHVKQDKMAWQRLVQAAQTAVQELNTNTQAQLNVPYIGMDIETRQPVHLETIVSRGLIEQKVIDKLVTDMILEYENGSASSILSPHVPVTPHNLSSLWMSLMTKLLTDVQRQPQDLGHVLVVGGGAKHAVMEKSLKECFAFFQTSVVLPSLSTRSELVALGASSILPQYEYIMDLGLRRLEQEDGDASETNKNTSS